jgi:polysaccharide export outer membrane protein
MKQKLALFSTLVVIFFNFSCNTYKEIPYFQDLNRTGVIQEEIRNYTPLTIQTGDILAISVTSLNPDATAIFNYNLNRVNGVNTDYTPTNSVVGFLVDPKGYIQLPLIGSMKVVGYTTTDLHDQVVKALTGTYAKEPIVNIRIMNFKISVMGDVLRPDVYSFQNEKVSITQALAAAGDLNITAKRNIILIREKDGKREFIPIDLTSKKIFESPYYYLKNNDIIYAEPDRTKYAPVDRGYRTATLIVSSLSAVAIILSAYLIQRN